MRFHRFSNTLMRYRHLVILGGQRDYKQVFANGFSGTVSCALCKYFYELLQQKQSKGVKGSHFLITIAWCFV